ncbi:hypothetical protein POTOM_045748 [Populus tomentosa]|uniref:Uncharacterized protein n=1 Tax=Populus tomentosa TaxID=118781 RepID=A0A8X7YIA0_POPTO|nr:hypothetical protein POTOM_045748 [Populus tomentosa]
MDKLLWISLPDLYFYMNSFTYRRSNFQQFLVKVMAQREENNVLKVSRLRISYPRVFFRQGFIISRQHGYRSLCCISPCRSSYRERHVLIDLKLNKLELPKLTNLHLEFCWWPSAILFNTECFDFSVACPNLVNLFLSHFDACRFGILKISGPKLVNFTVNWWISLCLLSSEKMNYVLQVPEIMAFVSMGNKTTEAKDQQARSEV